MSRQLKISNSFSFNDFFYAISSFCHLFFVFCLTFKNVFNYILWTKSLHQTGISILEKYYLHQLEFFNDQQHDYVYCVHIILNYDKAELIIGPHGLESCTSLSNASKMIQEHYYDTCITCNVMWLWFILWLFTCDYVVDRIH